MNRAKKEELRKEKKDAQGLSEDKKQAYYTTKRAEEAMQKLTREFHVKLFPEEYDYMYDSSSDAADRRQGNSPMNKKYILLRDKLRKELGFSPFDIKVENENTYAWVYNHIKHGRVEYLEKLFFKEYREGKTLFGVFQTPAEFYAALNLPLAKTLVALCETISATRRC